VKEGGTPLSSQILTIASVILIKVSQNASDSSSLKSLKWNVPDNGPEVGYNVKFSGAVHSQKQSQESLKFKISSN